MKPQYELAKKKILMNAHDLEQRLGLSWMTIQHRFMEAFKEDDDPNTIADTQTFWQYRTAVMRWFLPAVVRLTDDEIRRDVRHEYVHVIINPMESHVQAKWEEQCEFAVESMNIALGNALGDPQIAPKTVLQFEGDQL